MVPLSGMPKRRPAATSEVPAAPQIQRPGRGHRRADAVDPARETTAVPAGERDPCGLDASIVWLATRLSSHVSTSWASTSGAVLHEGLAREHDLALGHGPHVAREPQVGEVSEERRGEGAEAGEVGHVTLVVPPALEPGEGVVEALRRRGTGARRGGCGRTARRWPRG